jgi:hypothetical protein
MANIILLLIVAAVAALLLVLRTNALYVFFALCSGNVLVQFASKNMAYVNGHIHTNLLPHGYSVSKPSILLAILLIPPVLVVALAKHNNGPSKWPMQIFPAIATGILGILFVVPLLSNSLQNSITQNKFWSLFEQWQIPIVGLCVVVSVAILIASTYSHTPKKHHKV